MKNNRREFCISRSLPLHFAAVRGAHSSLQIHAGNLGLSIDE
jgi:hypothetical protein